MTGHVRRRGKKSWELKFDLGTDPLTGKRLTRFANFKGTKRDAEVELTRLISGAADGNYVDPSKTTVSEFLRSVGARLGNDECEPEDARAVSGARQDARQAAHRAYEATEAQDRAPSELYATLLREGRGSGLRSGLAPRTVGHVHRLLHRALGHAVRWGLVGANPAGAAEPPPVAADEIKVLTQDEVRTVLERLRGWSMFLVVTLAATTGMRRGELCALRWQDVDFEAGTSGRAVARTDEGRTSVQGAKDGHGRRRIALPAHWPNCAAIGEPSGSSEWRLVSARSIQTDLCSVAGRHYAIPNSLTKEWRRVVQA